MDLPTGYLIKIITNCLVQSTPYIALWMMGRMIYLHYHPAKKWADKEKWLWLLVVYLILLIQITVFRFGIDWIVWGEPRVVNLDPITTLRFLKPWAVLYNVVGNIGWFVPFGFLLARLWPYKQRFLPILFLGAGLSMSIELLQYLFNTGITDVDDLIFNTLGTVLGWLIYHLLALWRIWLCKKRGFSNG